MPLSGNLEKRRKKSEKRDRKGDKPEKEEEKGISSENFQKMQCMQIMRMVLRAVIWFSRTFNYWINSTLFLAWCLILIHTLGLFFKY